MLTIAPLLRAAFTSAKLRAKLLLLLTAFAGLLTSLAYTHATEILATLAASVSNLDNNSSEITEFSQQAAAHLPTLIFSQLALMAIYGALLPLWARAASPAGMQPWDGSFDAYLRRSVQSFGFLVTAAILTLVGLFFILIITSVLSSAGSGVGTIAFIAAVTAGLWMSIFLSSAAHTAIILASTDNKRSFTDAIKRSSIFLRPIVGTLAVIWFATILTSAAIEPILRSLVDGTPGARLATFLHGALGFLTAALHISVLHHIPGLCSSDLNR